MTRENAEFLADVVLNDDNYWVRYGALRSLLEVISLMSSDERPSAFELLLEVVRKISDRDLITQMLFKHVVIPTADTGWYDAIADIVRKAGERLSSADGDLVKNVLANAGEARESLKARESTQ